jgi:hypothetical protein
MKRNLIIILVVAFFAVSCFRGEPTPTQVSLPSIQPSQIPPTQTLETIPSPEVSDKIVEDGEEPTENLGYILPHEADAYLGQQITNNYAIGDGE